MESLAKNLPQIIKESAASPLGIVALMIIGLAILAFFFFKQAREKTRIGIFAMLFVGVAVLASAIVRVSNKPIGPGPNPPNPDTTTGGMTSPNAGSVPMAGKYPKSLVVPADEFKTPLGTYRILSATLDRESDDKLTLDFLVRYTRRHEWSGGTLGYDAFRLLLDDVPLAPTKAPSELVAVNSAKEGHVTFAIPPTARTVVFQVGEPQHGVRKIRMDLTATK